MVFLIFDIFISKLNKKKLSYEKNS
jgi:hypothetical protein